MFYKEIVMLLTEVIGDRFVGRFIKFVFNCRLNRLPEQQILLYWTISGSANEELYIS